MKYNKTAKIVIVIVATHY